MTKNKNTKPLKSWKIFSAWDYSCLIQYIIFGDPFCLSRLSNYPWKNLSLFNIRELRNLGYILYGLILYFLAIKQIRRNTQGIFQKFLALKGKIIFQAIFELFLFYFTCTLGDTSFWIIHFETILFFCLGLRSNCPKYIRARVQYFLYICNV